MIRAEIWAVPAAVLRLSDRIVVIEKGRTVWAGSSAELAAPDVLDAYLHI